MFLLDKFREAAISVLPIMFLVWILHLSVAPLEGFGHFLAGGILLIIGLGIFLLGAEIGIVPIGRRAGSAITTRRNLPLLLAAGFVIGFFITVAEPDVHVLAQQVAAVAPGLDTALLTVMIALGVGCFVAVALLRVALGISLRLVLLVLYAALFGCAAFTDSSFVSIAFDAGGATTGPMTVPFILALGIGVAAVRASKNQDDSFGLIGIASVGPVLAVLVMGMFVQGGADAGSAPLEPESEIGLAAHFLKFLPEVAEEVGMALAPLVGLFIAIRLFLLRNMTAYRARRTIMGLIYTYVGLVFFFIGVKGGFIPVGKSLGGILALKNSWLLFSAGLGLGSLAVLAEPAVWVLTRQVEDVSGGAIKSRVILIFLCVGVSLAVGLAMLRVSGGGSLWTYILPGYALALGMTFFCPPIFTAIAFDSGGVASGPMASTFILAFTLGASASLGGNPITDAFGVIAMIAMTPLIALQLLGLIYAHHSRRARNHPKAGNPSPQG